MANFTFIDPSNERITANSEITEINVTGIEESFTISEHNEQLFFDLSNSFQINEITEIIEAKIDETILNIVPEEETINAEPTESVIVVQHITNITNPTEVIEEVQPDYQKKIDWIDDNTFYTGWSDPGVADSAAQWKITKTTFLNVEGDVDILWADGTALFDKIWDNRATYTY